jgi:cobyrinic acid a,c-diamide synthase
VVKGFRDFLPESTIHGVNSNSVTPDWYQLYKPMIEEKSGIKVFGFLPEMPEAAIGDRHLGLITAGEIEGLHKKLDILAENTQKYVDIDGLIKLAQSAAPIEYEPPFEITEKYPCNIAVARDRAFCFYYEDSLQLLEEMGAHLTYFSPLEDDELPENISGLILGGGYPELYAKQLSENKTMLAGIKKAIEKGMPTYAECGGFMYLQQAITDSASEKYPMVGALEGNSVLQKQLSRFGYITLAAKGDNLLCLKGGQIAAHEFHYSDSDNNGSSFDAQLPGGGTGWECIFASDTLVAGYPHVHFYGNPGFAEKFVQKCSEFSRKQVINLG